MCPVFFQGAYMIAGKLLSLCGILWLSLAGLTACTTRQEPVTSEDAHREAVETLNQLDSELILDRELSLASNAPEFLVGSESLSISELSEHRALYGDALELDDDDFTLSTPVILPQPAPISHSSGKRPVPGSTQERSLAALNTKAALCGNGGETVCITSPYGVRRSSRRSHKGIDIRAPLGSPIMAFRSGVVVQAEYHASYGYMVDIQQDDGILARYAHMSQILTRKGDRVQPGLMIGRVGSTGRSTGPHLHFELIRNNSQVNPMALLPTPKQVVSKGTDADTAAARAALARSGKQRVKMSSKSGKKTSGPKNKKASATALHQTGKAVASSSSKTKSRAVANTAGQKSKTQPSNQKKSTQTSSAKNNASKKNTAQSTSNKKQIAAR
jgi:murein DD-endopeptidase MepM/ murein hydrolase activator NlpD